MADGFALRGFTQGFTQGLQNIDQLTTNWQTRDLRQKEVELQREQQDRQNRYNDYLIQNMERDNARLDRQQQVNEQSAGLDMEAKRNNLQIERMKMEQAQKQAELTSINDAVGNGRVDEPTWGLMKKYGFDAFLGIDPGKMEDYAGKLESGQIDPNDPGLMEVLSPVMKAAAMRNIGAKGVVPNTVYQNENNKTETLPRPGTPVMIATKDVIGFDKVGDKLVPRLRVQGAAEGGKFVSYEAPYTQYASSEPDDPLVAMSAKDLANKLRGAAYVNQRLKADPTLQERLKGRVQDVYQGIRGPIDPVKQAQIKNYESMDSSRRFQNQLKALETQADLALKDEQTAKLRFENSPENQQLKREYQQAKINATQASESLRRAREEYTGVQTGNALYGRPGLGSAKSRGGKTGAEKFDAKKAEMWFLNDVYAKDISAANDPQVMRQLPEYKNQIVNMINLGDGQVSQDLAQSILYDAIKQNLPVMKKPFQGKTYRGYAYNGKFYPFAVE